MPGLSLKFRVSGAPNPGPSPGRGGGGATRRRSSPWRGRQSVTGGAKEGPGRTGAEGREGRGGQAGQRTLAASPDLLARGLGERARGPGRAVAEGRGRRGRRGDRSLNAARRHLGRSCGGPVTKPRGLYDNWTMIFWGALQVSGTGAPGPGDLSGDPLLLHAKYHRHPHFCHPFFRDDDDDLGLNPAAAGAKKKKGTTCSSSPAGPGPETLNS